MNEGPKDKSDWWWKIHLNHCEQCRHTTNGRAYLERARAAQASFKGKPKAVSEKEKEE